MGDIEDEEEDSQESRLRVCSSQEPSPEEDDPSPPSSPPPRSPPSSWSSSRVIKSEAVSWPPLTVSQPPVMTIPPHILSELMSSVDRPVSLSLQSSSSSSVGLRATGPPPLHSPAKRQPSSAIPTHRKVKESSSFRPIEPNVSLHSPSLSFKPLPLSRQSDANQPSETKILTSQLPLNMRLNEVPRIVLPQHPLPNVKKK